MLLSFFFQYERRTRSCWTPSTGTFPCRRTSRRRPKDGQSLFLDGTASHRSSLRRVFSTLLSRRSKRQSSRRTADDRRRRFQKRRRRRHHFRGDILLPTTWRKKKKLILSLWPPTGSLRSAAIVLDCRRIVYVMSRCSKGEFLLCNYSAGNVVANNTRSRKIRGRDVLRRWLYCCRVWKRCIDTCILYTQIHIYIVSM